MCNVFVNLYLSYVQIISDKLQGESKKGEYRDFAYNTEFYLGNLMFDKYAWNLWIFF